MDESVDASMLDGLKELGEEEFAEIITLFLNDTAGYIEQINRAIAGRDAVGLKRSAHALKGSSSTVGAKPMSVFCAQLEGLGDSGTVEGAQALSEKLTAEFKTVQTVLARYK